MNSKLSFTIRRPSPHPHSTNSTSQSISRQPYVVPYQIDSSDEEADANATEFVTGFDDSGVQRLHEKPKPSGPLVIAPLANRDWRAVAVARKRQRFVPDGVAAPTGKDGSQGGLGTRDTINSGQQVAGLVKRDMVVAEAEKSVVQLISDKDVETSDESEDERARKALLASACGDDGNTDALSIDAIPLGMNGLTRPLFNETDAYREDVITRPDSATLADYERVPVSQFGAALLRGMGWKEGTAASRKRQGPVEPWLPTSRPALLGIGAKERPPEDVPAVGKGFRANTRPEKRYVPVIKMQREGSAQPPPPSRSRSRSPPRSGGASRVPSKSSSPYPSDKDKPFRRHSRDRTHDDYQDKQGRDRDHGGRSHSQGVDRSRDRRGDRDDRVEPHRYERSYEERDRRGRDYGDDVRGSSARASGSRY